MESLLFWVGVLGNIISVLLFLSPAKTFVRIVKHGNTEEFSCIPYICTLLNSCLWTYYGVTKPDAYLVATVNGFGVAVEIVYVALFIFYASPSKRRETAVIFGAVDVGFFGAAVLTTSLLMQGDVRIDAIGFVASALNIVMYASPLAAMKRVVTTKSVEYMPFLLTLFLFINGGIWTFYAVLAQDWFLGVPNGMGFLLGILQLALYAIYSSRTHPSKPDSHHTDPLLPLSDSDAQSST